MERFAIKFTNGGVPYYTGTGLNWIVYASDSPDRAYQFPSREMAESILPVRGVDGNVLPAIVVKIPRWAHNC